MPSGLAEELALERHAALEHAARAAALWRARCYADSLAESAAADAACARVRELEAVR